MGEEKEFGEMKSFQEEHEYSRSIMRFGAMLDLMARDDIPDANLRHRLVILAVDKTFSPLHYKKQEEEAERLKANAPKCPKCSGKTRLIDKPGMKFWGCIRYPDCQGTIDFEEWEASQKSEGVKKEGEGKDKPTRTKSEERAEPKKNTTQSNLSSQTAEEMRVTLDKWIKDNKLSRVPSDYWHDDDTITLFYDRFRKCGVMGWNRFCDDFRK